ncbi:MAG: excinuclease ABC subunit UvrB [archaeon]
MGVTGSGKSLDYAEEIVIRDDNSIECIEIGKFVERNLRYPKKLGNSEYQKISGYKILSFNPTNYKISENYITEVSKHKEKYVYQITLDDYSTIRVSAHHNCYKFGNLKFELCKTSELSIGDFLPLSNRILKPKSKKRYLNVLEYNPNAKLAINKLIGRYDPDLKKLSQYFRKEYPAGKWKLNEIRKCSNNRGVLQRQVKEILSLLNVSLIMANKYINIITKKRDTVRPLIPIDDKFLTFSGLYVSEGHNTGQYILISNSNRGLQSICKSFYNSLGLKYYQRNKNDIAYHSTLLCSFFSCFGHSAHTKTIPNIVYELSDKQLSIFLRSVFDGDGWVEQNSVHIGSVSNRLINNLRRLLLRYDITSRIRIKQSRGEFFILNISGKRNISLFRKYIGFSIQSKKEKLNMIQKECANTNVDIIPDCADFLSRIRMDHSLYQKDMAQIAGCNRSYISMIENGKRHPSKRVFGKIIEWFISKNERYKELQNILTFNYRRIIKIQRIRTTNNYVYDLSVARNENFMAGNGNVFVHNTFTMAHVVNEIKKPTLVLAHNKTLAAQLYNEFRELFPANRVEYFVSYYDYYQPESYLPQKDQYIEKDADINPKLDQMRQSATASLLSREDVIIVSSVSCIYGLGNPENYKNLGFELSTGQKIGRNEILKKLVAIQYERNNMELLSGRFRAKGDTIDIVPGYYNNIIRIEMCGDEIERIVEIEKKTGRPKEPMKYYYVFPARHFVIPDEIKEQAIESIKEELEESLPKLGMIEAHRLKKRTLFDIEMIEETGYCKGIENYSRHFDGRKSGEKPYCLLDYFPDDFLMIIDESHQSIPQVHGMFNGDRSRKKTLIDYGFRLNSAYDNRPLRFEEFEGYMKNVVFVSATPGQYELEKSSQVVEQIIRPTGLIDPEVMVRPIDGQIEDLKKEIRATVERGDRVLVTTLTKKLAEELTEFLSEGEIKTRYLHSEIDTLERTEIIRQLRLGKFDVLVGINLLREGLDIPEVGFIGILDADKEGFLRDAKSLIQIIGRAARNVNSSVVLYADNMTDSIIKAIDETNRRRALQMEHNKKNGITPQTIVKPVKEKEVDVKDTKHIPKKEIPNLIIELDSEMKEAAELLDFERAIELRERIKGLEKRKS